MRQIDKEYVMRARWITITFPIAALLFALSCSDESNVVSGGDDPFFDYIPTMEGCTWEYDVLYVSGSYDRYTRIDTISGTREINGENYAIIECAYPHIPDYYEHTFFADDGTSLLTHRGYEVEQNGEVVYYFDYGSVLPIYDYPFVTGNEWDVFAAEGANPSEVPTAFLNWVFAGDDIDGDGIDDTLDITISAEVLEREDVTVPAGDFAECCYIRYDADSMMHMSHYGDYRATGTKYVWFRPNVGVVKSHMIWEYSMGSEQEIVELVSYDFPYTD